MTSIWSAIWIIKSLSVWKTVQMALSFYVHAFCSRCSFALLLVLIGLGKCTAEATLPLLFLSLGFHPEPWLNSMCLHVIRRDCTPEQSSWVPPGKACESVAMAELTDCTSPYSPLGVDFWLLEFLREWHYKFLKYFSYINYFYESVCQDIERHPFHKGWGEEGKRQ